MGSGRVEDNFPLDDVSTKQENLIYSKVFDEVFPYFMSIGVSYDQFWNVGSDLFKICRYAREAEQLRIKRVNEEQWWLSIYLRRTLLDVSPAFRDFHKGNKIDIECSTKEPMPMSQEEIDERKRRDDKRNMENMMSKVIEYGMKRNAELRKEKKEKQLQEETQKELTITIEKKRSNEEDIALHETSIGDGYKQMSFFEESEETVSKETQ